MDRQPASSTAAAVVDCAVYVDGMRLPGTHTPESALGEVWRRGSGFVWLGLFAPTFEQMTAVAQTYGLHELVAEDSVHAHQRPKLEQYDEVTVLVMRTAHYLSPTSIRTAPPRLVRQRWSRTVRLWRNWHVKCSARRGLRTDLTEQVSWSCGMRRR